MDKVLLKVKLLKAQLGLLANVWYYFWLPAFEKKNGVVTKMTDDRARELFLSDANNYKTLISSLPDACSNWVEFGDLITPPPADLPDASVLRISHVLRADGSFDVLAELLNATSADIARVEIVGLNGTVWSQSGKYAMGAQVSTKDSLSYSYLKTFTGLKAGNTIEYRVSVNEQTTYLSAQISVENVQPTKGPVWGSWKPGKITPGAGYVETLPLDAATGTGGAIYYRLVSGPTWFNYGENSRSYVANPTPLTVPTSPVEVVFSAEDSNGKTSKAFVLEFTNVLDMYIGVAHYFNGAATYIGLGPEDPQGYSVKMSCLTPGVSWSGSGALTAEHASVGINSITYPYKTAYLNVPIGVFLIEGTRLSDGQKRYALFEQNGDSKQLTLTPSATPPAYTPKGFQPKAVGDIWELVAVGQSVVSRFIDLVDSFKEGENPVAVFMERLSPSGSTRKYVGGGVWNIPINPSTLITITPNPSDPATAVISAPQGSVSADAVFGVTFTPDDTKQVHEEPVRLINVDPAVVKPVRQAKLNDIYWDQPGAKRFPLIAQASWFQNSAGASLSGNQTDGTNLYALPQGVSLYPNNGDPYLEITADTPNIKVPLRFTCANGSGSDNDTIQFWLNRQAVQSGTRFIDLITEFWEETSITAKFLLKDSVTGLTSKFTGTGVWNIPSKPSNLVTITAAQNDPATAVISAPQGSVSADAVFGVTFTPDDTHDVYQVSLKLKNVDPAVPKPVRKTKLDDIYWNQAGAKRFQLIEVSSWFTTSGTIVPNVVDAQGNLLPLPTGVTFSSGGGYPYLEITDGTPNFGGVLRFTCSNASGSDYDQILFQIDRQGASPAITGIWRKFVNTELSYYVHGPVLDQSDRYKVRYRQTPAGTYNGVTTTDWSPNLISCTPGSDNTGLSSWYRSYGNTGQGIQTRVEFQVWDPQTSQGVGPIIPLDFTIPALGSTQPLTQVYPITT